MSDELYIKHRPPDFKDVVGQDEAVACLVDMGKRKAIPHCVLFTGPSGTGKTTLARILRRKMKCGDADFCEINAAQTRGIDMVRDIQSRVNLSPISGKCRVWLIDECFAKGTHVATLEGPRPIETIRIGDIVQNLEGWTRVKNTFRNRIPLERLIRLRFSDGRVVHTTLDHKFLTEEGWVEAQNLTSSHYLQSLGCYTMCRKEHSNAQARNGLSRMRNSLLDGHLEDSEDVFEKLRSKEETETCREWTDRTEAMRRMRENFFLSSTQRWAETAVLRKVLSVKMEKCSTGVSSKSLFGGSSTKDRGVPQAICKDGGGPGSSSPCLQSYEEIQPYVEREEREENAHHSGSKWDAPCLERETRGQWPTHSTADRPLGCSRERMETGASHTNKSATCSRLWLSNKLQSGPRASTTQDSYRGRWERPSIEKKYNLRQQKGSKDCRVWLVDAEIYERGREQQSFSGVVGDTDLRRGYVEFYDLEIAGNPSYFAEGLPVHNCHSLTADAQGAFLKLLEDTPRHAYFFLATTDPHKLKNTIITRSTEVRLRAVPDNVLKNLVKDIAQKESVTLSDDVADKLVAHSDGSARKALVLLHSLIGLKTEDEQLAAIAKGDYRAQAIELCRVLMNKTASWKDIATILKGLEDDEEGLRRAVLGYANAIMLKAENSRAYMILEEFLDPFYNAPKAGLTAACYRVFQANK